MDPIANLVTKYSNKILELDGADMEPGEIPLLLTEFSRELEKIVIQPGEEFRFKPTHRHKEGGLYQIRAMLSVHIGGEWKPAMLYRNASMAQFVRELNEFYARFDPLEEPGG